MHIVFVRRLDLHIIESTGPGRFRRVSISQNRSNLPCDACDKLLFKKVIFQTHQASAHDGNQYINPIKEDPDGVEGEPVKELREKR